MIAHLVVEVLTGDSPDFDRAAYTFNGEVPHGWIGIVDDEGEIRATEGDLEFTDHSELGYSSHTGRWRFATNRRIKTVLWTTPPTPRQMFAVTDWLEYRGYRVQGHTQDFNAWRGF